MKQKQAPNGSDGPATLVAIIVAARRAGDRELERETRRRLEDQFRVKLSFARNVNYQEGESDAN